MKQSFSISMSLDEYNKPVFFISNLFCSVQKGIKEIKDIQRLVPDAAVKQDLSISMLEVSGWPAFLGLQIPVF